MRLSRPTIRQAISAANLVFDPQIDPDQVTASSVDLRLGNRFIRFDQEIARQKGIGADIRFDIGTADWDALVKQYGATEDIDDDKPFQLDVGRLVLGWTKEYIKLPPTLAGSVEGKSRPARFGLLVHITAPTLHCGWEGHIQLEFYNVGAAPLILRPGIRICQIILEEVTEAETYEGQFQAQRSDPK